MKLKETAAIVLASGQSKRYGDADKLLALLSGKPVAQHVADCIVAAGVGFPIAVAPRQRDALSDIFSARGFQLVENAHPEHGQGASLALGGAVAINTACEGVFVCLADMPFVTPALLHALSEKIDDADAVVCMAEGRMSPPVLFSKEAARGLATITGDVGAKNYIATLKNVMRVEAGASLLRDIDTVDDLNKAATAKFEQ